MRQEIKWSVLTSFYFKTRANFDFLADFSAFSFPVHEVF